MTSAGVIALDPNQQTIYAISQSGLTVLNLPSVVDQIAFRVALHFQTGRSIIFCKSRAQDSSPYPLVRADDKPGQETIHLKVPGLGAIRKCLKECLQ
jgi:hypothetical protein